MAAENDENVILSSPSRQDVLSIMVSWTGITGPCSGWIIAASPGFTSCRDMGEMEAPPPGNTLPMVTRRGLFGPSETGGMFATVGCGTT